MYRAASLSDISTVSDSELSYMSEICDLSSGYSINSATPHHPWTQPPKAENHSCQKIFRHDINRKMTFCHTSALSDDLRLITEMPDVCDVVFLVGKGEVSIYGVKAIMATRSRFLYQTILAAEKQLSELKNIHKGKFCLLAKLKQMTKKKSSSSEKRKATSRHIAVHLPGEDPASFRHVIQFLHSGRINVGVDNIIDVMSTAHNYGLTDLYTSCFHFATSFINLDTILPLLISTLEFSQNKWIKRLLIKIWDFVDENATLIFQSSGFEDIPKEAAMLILSRPKLSVTETEIWKVVSAWSRRHCQVTDTQTFDRLVQELLAVVNCSQNRTLEITEDGDSIDDEEKTEVDKSHLEMKESQNDFSFISPMSMDSVKQFGSGFLKSGNLDVCQESVSSDSGVTSSTEDYSLSYSL